MIYSFLTPVWGAAICLQPVCSKRKPTGGTSRLTKPGLTKIPLKHSSVEQNTQDALGRGVRFIIKETSRNLGDAALCCKCSQTFFPALMGMEMDVLARPLWWCQQTPPSSLFHSLKHFTALKIAEGKFYNECLLACGFCTSRESKLVCKSSLYI